MEQKKDAGLMPRVKLSLLCVCFSAIVSVNAFLDKSYSFWAFGIACVFFSYSFTLKKRAAADDFICEKNRVILKHKIITLQSLCCAVFALNGIGAAKSLF